MRRVVLTAQSLATISTNSDSAYHAIKHAALSVHKIIEKHSGTTEQKRDASKILHSTLLQQTKYTEYLERTKALIASICGPAGITELDFVYAGFENFNLEKYIEIYWKGIYLHQIAELTVTLPEATPAAALDFECCSTANFHVAPPQFKRDPWFKVTKLLIALKPQPLPAGIFCLMPFLVTADFSRSTLTHLPARTFYGNGALKELILPPTLTSLGDDALSSTGLETIALPSSLQIIGTRCFASSLRLASVTFDPAALRKIKNHAFSSCASLRNTLPIRPGTILGSNIYTNCISLTEVSLEHHDEVPSAHFFDCNSIATLEIPATVTRLGRSAFRGCYSLTSVSIKARDTPLLIEKSVFAATAIKAIDASSAVFTNLQQRWIPALPSSISVALVSREHKQELSLICRSRSARLHVATKEGRVNFKREIYSLYGRPSFLPFPCAVPIPDRFKYIYMLVVHSKKRKIPIIPTELWQTIFSYTKW